MKILIICSKRFYNDIPVIKQKLKEMNIEVFLPNCYDNTTTEERMWNLGKEEHQKFKANMYKQSEYVINKTYSDSLNLKPINNKQAILLNDEQIKIETV